MNANQNASVLSQQVVFPKKEVKPELTKVQNDHRYVERFYFNGSIFRAKDSLWVDGQKISDNIMMKANCMCAISQTNKRYLKNFDMMKRKDNFVFGEILTDYVEPNPLLFKSLGFSEEESKKMVFAKNVNPFPFGFSVEGYNVHDGYEVKSKLEMPKVWCKIEGGAKMTLSVAIPLLTRWFYDNGLMPSDYEVVAKNEDVKTATEAANLSKEALEYGEQQSSDPWVALEHAMLYDAAAFNLKSIMLICEGIYEVLSKKYEHAGIILAETMLTFGLNENLDVCLYGELGTPNNSLLASKEIFEKEGTLESMDKSPIRCYIDNMENAYIQNGEDVPENIEIPDEILEGVSDIYTYMAELLVDEMEFLLYF